MIDLVVGIGLVLVIEGLLWAAFPQLGARMMEVLAVTPERTLRLAGVVSMVVGVAIVWLVRG